MLPTRNRQKGYFLVFALLLSVCLPFYSFSSFAITDYYDIFVNEKEVVFDWNKQMGKEYLIVYENLYLDVIAIENEGPLQGFLQTGITYDNAKTDGQTTFKFNLKRLNFFNDTNEDNVQTWNAIPLDAGYKIIDIDNLTHSFTPISSINWVKNHTEFNNHSGVKNFKFIPFIKAQIGGASVLTWGIEETLIYAFKKDNIIYWDQNISLDLRLFFYFTIKDNTASLEHKIHLENCSISDWFQKAYNYSSINLALEWNNEVTVTKGLAPSPVAWYLDDVLLDCSTASNITKVAIGEVIESNVTIALLNLGRTYIENNSAIHVLHTSAIPLQNFSRQQRDVDFTQLLYSQTVLDYDKENIYFASLFEFYFASSTLSIIFIILFNVILSVILVRNELKFQRREGP